jgi:hypothetical protein
MDCTAALILPAIGPDWNAPTAIGATLPELGEVRPNFK